MEMAPWLRGMVRQITLTDVPPSWRVEHAEQRSYNSQIYDTRVMLRLDSSLATKLQQSVRQFGTSKADIIRQLIIQATPEDFPTSCHMRAAERRAPQGRRHSTGSAPEPRL
jgi:hypothetical protein